VHQFVLQRGDGRVESACHLVHVSRDIWTEILKQRKVLS
jgi:hypothetical protein